jgi:uncharacterized protein YkwD
MHLSARRGHTWGRILAAAAVTSVVITGQMLTGRVAPLAVHADVSFDSALFALVNQDRADNGIAPLLWNSTLSAVAESQQYSGCGFTISGRAQDLLQRNYFSHTICGAQNVFNVMQSIGLPYGWAGENIGWESGYTDPQQAAQYLNTQYMNSPEHKANILNPNFTDVGVGSALEPPGVKWTGGGQQPMSNVYMSVEDFASLPATAPRVPIPAGHDGYWIAGGDGAVYDFGAPGDFGGENGHPLNKPIVGMATTPDQTGYWLVASDGGIFPHGTAAGYGSTGGSRLNQPIVGMAATPSGRGYWLVASDGGVFPFGDAGGYGSTGAVRLNQPIVGMAATPSGHGYWLVASDGGIFPFGDAGGYGSTGAVRLNQPIVGMAATPSGHGYWLVARDGGIFPFGDAGGYGSTGAVRLNQPIVDMSTTRTGHGYWLVAADGGVFPFGDAAGMGSTGGQRLGAPIVALAHG